MYPLVGDMLEPERGFNIDMGVQTECEPVSLDTSDLEAVNAFMMEISAGKADFKVVDYTVSSVKAKLKANLAKCKASTKLTYFLKCKYAFSARTPSVLVAMRSDARVWLTA